ncbi:MAG TPA: CNNM domain-containing protein [Phycisphaerales bacterium]|nr:CNNM domain-containing protein [Phycisphaerales bacterium]
MTIDPIAGWVALAVVGIAGSALCSGTETGLYTLNRVRLSVRAAHAGPGPGRAARLLQAEVEHPDRALAALLIANTFFNNLGAVALTGLLAGAGYSEWGLIALEVLILTPVLFVVAETLPKEVFRAEADHLMPRAVYFLLGVRWLLTATLILPAVGWIARRLTRLLGTHAEASLGSARQRIAALLKEGARHGVLSEAQTTLLDRAMAMRDTTVGDEMLPWARVRTLSEAQPWRQVAQVLRQAPFSRYPVLDGSGRVVGVVEHLDLCLAPGTAPGRLARPAISISPRTPVREALAQLTRAGARLAIVSRGERPLGIVTAKDLVEPLTGELAAW